MNLPCSSGLPRGDIKDLAKGFDKSWANPTRVAKNERKYITGNYFVKTQQK